MDIPEDRRCQAIGWHSLTQCKQRRLRGKDYCRAHDRSPTKPPEERTGLIEMIDEIIACQTEIKPGPASRHVSQAQYDASPDDFIIICRGTSRENIVPRCQAKSKRSGKRCRNASCRGKRVCRMHGGSSQGPKSTENCGQHFLVHGKETRVIRRRRKQANAELMILARVIAEHGL